MKYKARFSGCEFRQSDSRTIQLNENFDLAFVDARHSMKLVRNDFNKVKDHSKYVAFHDIINPYASVTEVWEPLKKQYKHWEIIDSNESYSCGIGVIKL
jgi:tRNA A58 N-methylase Trm61